MIGYIIGPCLVLRRDLPVGGGSSDLESVKPFVHNCFHLLVLRLLRSPFDVFHKDTDLLLLSLWEGSFWSSPT